MPREASHTAELIELCQSEFERVVFRELVQRGYHVTPQVGSVGFSIDMVVEGEGGRRLAIECDGDRYHGPERWADDMRRQRILERVGWNFWRCFGSNYSLDPDGVLADLIETLDRMNIKPVELGAVSRGFSQHRTDRAEAPEPRDAAWPPDATRFRSLKPNLPMVIVWSCAISTSSRPGRNSIQYITRSMIG
jgi:very-short-patch-repair endonuclease